MRDLKSRRWLVLTCREGYSIVERATGLQTYLNTGTEGEEGWKRLRRVRYPTAAFEAACKEEFEACKKAEAIQ